MPKANLKNLTALWKKTSDVLREVGRPGILSWRGACLFLSWRGAPPICHSGLEPESRGDRASHLFWIAGSTVAKALADKQARNDKGKIKLAMTFVMAFFMLAFFFALPSSASGGGVSDVI